MDELSFRTKTGRCVIHPDRLVLERTGARGALASSLLGDSLTRVRVFYGFMVFALALTATLDVIKGRVEWAIFEAALAALLARNVMRTLGLSATPVLIRSAITKIEAHAPVAPVTRGYFVVHFTENGKTLRRNVILPGVIEGGAEEFKRALELLRSEGLPVS